MANAVRQSRLERALGCERINMRAKQASMNISNMYDWTERAKAWCKNLYDLADDVMYSSTNTDRLCMDCAKKHHLCKHCGGDISMRARRKDWPEKDAE